MPTQRFLDQFGHLTRTALMIGLCVGLLLRLNTITTNLKNNFQTIAVTRDTALGPSPWFDLAWWSTLCAPSTQRGSVGYSTPIVSSDLPLRSVASSRLAALSQLNRGDCPAAIEALEQTESDEIGIASNQIMLAHLYAMTASWDKASALVSPESVSNAPQKVRRFWANVYYRAGAMPSVASTAREKWLLAADELVGVYPLDGSVSLAYYLAAAQRPTEAFDELRRAMILMPAGEALALHQIHASLRVAALAENSRLHPDNEEAKRLYAKYSSDTQRNNAATTIIQETAPLPRFEFQEEVTPTWLFLGLDIDEDDLQLGSLVHVAFHWCQRSASGCAHYTTVTSLEYNLAGNSGFEVDPIATGIKPFGFYAGYYGETAPYPYAVVLNQESQRFCLSSEGNRSRSGVLTPWRRLDDQMSTYVLLGGYFRSRNHNAAYFGLHWRSDTNEGLAHIETQGATNEWTRAARLVELPPDVRDVALHILAPDVQASACYDDLFAFVLPFPPAEVDP